MSVVKELPDNDHRMTVRNICDKTEYSYGTVFSVIHDELGMRRLGARSIPLILDIE